MAQESSNISKEFLKFATRIHIFKEMNEADILSITKDIQFKKFQPGEVIITQGVKGDEVFYLLKGKCNIVANKVIVGSFSSGTLVGEIASITGEERTASVRVIEETSLFSFKIDFTKESKFPIGFYKYYKNIAFDLISKLSNANKS